MARQIAWLPPGGGEIVLNDAASGYRVMTAGTRGLSSPPYRLSTATYAGMAGSTLQAIQPDEREVGLGLRIEGDTPSEFRARFRALVRAFRPLAGNGILSVTDEFGMARRLACRYVGGLEGDAVAESAGVVGFAVVRLTAFDPWWRGDTRTIDTGIGVAPPFFPIFPMRLAPSSVQGQFTVDLSDTDAPTFPLWTVTGPGSALTLANTWNAFNAETGELETKTASIVVNAPLAAGQSMVIDTRPGFQSVRRGDGTNLMGAVSTDPALWRLVEGVNEVSALLTDTTSASRIVGVYEPQYAGI